MFRIFARHNDQHGKCKFVLASESGQFKEEGWADIFPASYHCDMSVGLLLYSSSRYSRTCLLNGLLCHAFRFRTNAVGIKAVNGNSYTIDLGNGHSDSFTGTGKPQRHLHDYTEYPARQGYPVRITASSDAITGIFMRDAALIYDDIPVRLAAIDVSQCASLEQLALPQFSGINELNLKGNPKLRNLSIECHSIETLDLSGDPKMEYLYLALYRNLKILDLSGCPALRVLDIVGTYALEELLLNENTALNKVKLSSDSRRKFNPEQLMRIALRNRTAIEYF